MIAGDCEIIPQSLIAKYGRTNLFTATGLNGGVIGTIAQSEQGEIGGAIQDTIMGSVPVATATHGTAARFIWSQSAGSQIIPYVAGPAGPGTNEQDAPFTEAVVIPTPMWNTNSGQNFGPNLTSEFADNYSTQTNVQTAKAVTGNNQLHYFPPVVINVNAAAATTAGGGLVNGTTYYYIFTLTALNQAATTVLNANFGQETSPTFTSGGVGVGAGQNSIVLTVSGSAGQFSAFSGNFPNDPTAKYITNIYRSSSTQPTFFYVASAFGITFTDGYPDSNSVGSIFQPPIDVNQQLTLNRDPAPVKAQYDWLQVVPSNLVQYNSGIVNPNYGTSGNTPINTYFQGAPMCGHQGRLWYFVAVQNSDTNFSAQLQLWYSNLNRKWEFDKVNNVFLVDQANWTWPTNPGPAGSGTTTSALSINPYLYPNSLYLEMPSAMISVQSVLVFWTTQRMIMLYGNSPATYVFQVFGNIGCSSPNSVAYAATPAGVGAFWMSENGVFFTNTQSYQYISEDIRNVIDSLSPQDRYTCTGFYEGHNYYISFPVLNQTWAYNTTTNQWHGPMPYSTPSASDVPSDPVFGNVSAASNNMYNSVIAVRPSSLNVDSWFSQVDTDLGNGQTVTYQTRDQGTIAAPTLVQAGLPVHIEKEYTHIAIVHKVQNAPVGTLFATVVVTVNDDPTQTCTKQFDLSLGPCQIDTLSNQGLGGGPLRGYMANMSISFTTISGNATAPIQIKNCTIYGKPAQRNLTPTVGMSFVP